MFFSPAASISLFLEAYGWRWLPLADGDPPNRIKNSSMGMR